MRLPATTALIVANLAVFAAMLFAGAGLWHAPNEVQLAWGANFGPATRDGEWWRLVSAMFLHFGVIHLGVNMLALEDVGRLVERMLGQGRFLALYFVAGIGGNLLSLAMQGDRGISGGASGAVFGLFGALLVLLWRRRGAIEAREFRWLFWGAAGFAAMNIVLGMVVPGIDNGAHLGGLVGGALAALALDAAAREQAAHPWRRCAAAAALAAAFAALLLSLPAPRYHWTEEKAARAEIQHFVGEDAAIRARWNALVGLARREGMSFDELAARLDSDVAQRYEASFEQLSSLHLDSRVPSAPAVATLRQYAQERRDATRIVVEGLRASDSQRVRQGLDMARAAVPGRKSAQASAGALPGD